MMRFFRIYRQSVVKLTATIFFAWLLLNSWSLLTPQHAIVNAQTTPPPVTITGFDPSVVVAGQATDLNITGTNFTANSTVQVPGVGAMTSTFVNPSLVRIALPSTMPLGQYNVQVDDPVGGSAVSPQPFSVIPPSATPTATPSPTATATVTATSTLTETPTTTALPPMIITSSEPGVVSSGRTSILSVFGVNFPAGSTIRILGFGLLATTYMNSSSLTGVIPDTIPPGQFLVEVIDPIGRTARAPSHLIVLGPTPLPPTETPLPTQTIVPTPIPGQPSLFVRAFTVVPSVIEPGKSADLTFEIINQGNYDALGIGISVDSGSKFLPANGQAGAAVAIIAAGMSTQVALRVVAAADSTPGPTSIPITLTYSSVDGKALSSKVSLSVSIRKVTIAPQVLLVNYSVNPESVEAGKPVNVQVQLKNVGNETAPQVLLRLPDSDSLLLPGSRGSRFSAGTLNPGAQTQVNMPLVVPPEAKDGLQTQSLIISYTDGDKVQEIPVNISVKIVKPITLDPLFVLTEYGADVDPLKPGDKFQFKLQLKNIGKANASNLVVTFGTVNNTGSGSSDAMATPFSQSGDTSLSYVPSSVFAPLKTSGTILVGDVEVEKIATLTQEFIVNAAIPSGIYGLPITLRYRMPDGSSQQSTLQASLIVVVPPKIQIVTQTSLPSTANVGESINLMLKIVNSGKAVVNLSTVSIEAENASIIDGAESSLNPLEVGNNVVVASTIVPAAEGNVVIKVSLAYWDDLNHLQTIEKTYQLSAVLPPPPATFEVSVENTVVEEAPQKDLLQQILFGVLGLGS